MRKFVGGIAMNMPGRATTRAVVVGAILIVAAGAGAWIRSRADRPPLAQLARAYTGHRGIELRVPGADYAPLEVTRGPGSSDTSGLSEIGALIRNHFERNREIDDGTPGWWQAKGREALLENYDGHAEDAIAALELARDLGNGASQEDVAIDLATAYFERARDPRRAIDFSMAIELLSRTLAVNPRSSVARFNRAMVFERAYDYPNAADDWRRYLAIDGTSSWAAEARRELEYVEEKIEAPASSAKNVDDLIELESDRAMRSALTADRTAEIAAVLSDENQDRWFADALPFRGTATAKLLGAMAATRAGLRMDLFESELGELRSLASRVDSEPLRIWLEFEELFRVTHSPKVAGCLAGVGDLVETCRRRHYAWFLIQTLLERSSCEAARGDFAAAEATDGEAMEFASTHMFPVASLRAAGLLTGYLAASGQYRDAADRQHESLQQFWSRPIPYPRGQELFHDMVLANEGLGRFYAAKASAQSAALLAQRSGVAMNEAVNRARWAGFSARLGLNQEAAEQYSLASKLFDGMADSRSVDQYRAFAESFVVLAADGSSLTRFDLAVKTSTNPFVVVSYLHTAAALAERAKEFEESRLRLEEAIAVIENNRAPDSIGPPALEWREQLQSCYRDLTRVLLLQNDIPGSYRIWQDFLRADQLLEGFRPGASAAEGAEATVVTFARLGDRYGVWVRTGDSVRFDWVNQDAPAIDRLVRNYSELCSQRGTSWTLAQKAAKPLVTSLLGFALSGTLKNRVLLIQPDRELARLPWASLALPSGEPLGERFLVAVLPASIASTGPLRIPEIRVRHALVVGATSFDSSYEFRPLAGIEEEVAAVRRAFPHAEVLEGPEASPARLSKAIEEADALHFAGHALLAGGRIQLLVAPDASSKAGLWRPGDGQRLHLNLAVLSACSTARYREPEDPRPDNLASALLLDGAQQVIATLWDADSSATSYFMQSFYRHLRLNQPSTEAFAEASAETRRQAAWANPYYWASFSLFLRA
jgi:tetratricopeptide (TPR) repeat protein